MGWGARGIAFDLISQTFDSRKTNHFADLIWLSVAFFIIFIFLDISRTDS